MTDKMEELSMNYWNTLEAAKGISLKTYVVSLGLGRNAGNFNDTEPSDTIIWSAVSAQTDMYLTEAQIDWLHWNLSASQWIDYLANELGYKGVLLVVSGRKYDGRWCSDFQGYHYLADPDWAQIGTELGRLVEQVLASYGAGGEVAGG